MNITRVETIPLTVPAGRGRVSLTDPAPVPTSLVAVRLHTDTPHIGLGFATVVAGSRALQSLLDIDLAPIVVGEDPTESERLFAKAQGRFRSTGWAGLAARAYAAIDIALWDLKAKAAGLPLFRLLGASRTSAAYFAGDLAPLGMDAHQTIKSATPLIEQGVLGVAVDVGGSEVQVDADRVQQIRDGIGESAWLGISVDGRYDIGTALAMAHFYEEDVGIDWIDSPLPAEDRIGYQRLAERMEVPLALGSSFDDRDSFRRCLEAGAIRVLRPDPLRLGGITPLLKIAALADAFSVSVVPYRLPEIGVHLACGLPNVPMAEWGSWLAPIVAEPIVPRDGKLVPPDRPGHGFELNPDSAVR
ncbi:MAG TPA: mandelate racemase/muconate lactonizing enzyme family protein [Gemmataceae bacterium]|jgi:L-alanine-DL-glutamate epimerase-like enolase superfamily enzyme|nr:mandelate racemase/muconate lactonizing enzyme family protein [Gemmataceae bacterium]